MRIDRLKPFRSAIFPTRAREGADERLADGVLAGSTPGLEGDLAALAANIPGVLAAPGGISILGLPAAQSAITLGGMAFDVRRLPRGARLFASVATAPYDPSRGGFSAGEIALDIVPGGRFQSRTLDLEYVGAPTEFGRPASSGVADAPSSISVGLSGRGRLIEDALYYSGAVEARRALLGSTSLLTASPEELRSFGLSPDSAARFLALVGRLGIPSNVASGSGMADELNLLTRVDYRPSAPDGTRAAVTGYLDVSREEGRGVSAEAMPTTGVSRSAGAASLMGHVSTYLRGSYLSETRVGFTYGWDREMPGLTLPGGIVQLAPDNGRNERLSLLMFGGGSGSHGLGTTSLAQLSSRLTWYDMGGRHRFQLYGDVRLEHRSRSVSDNLLGRFTYASLAELASNEPTSYVRSLRSTVADGRQLSASFSLADSWRATRSLSVLYGARLDANRFLAQPELNRAALSAFGLDTRRLPTAWSISPRFGFSWVPSGKRSSDRYYDGPLGTRFLGAPGVLRGGIGDFRNTVSTELATDAMAKTGLPDAGRQLLCIGPAVPSPIWARFAEDPETIPDGCTAGAEPVWTASNPDISAFAVGFRPEHSVRANLGWESRVGKVQYSVDAVYSWNLDQHSVVDANLASSPAFRLPNEAARPVFVPPSAILPATGMFSISGSRIDPAFGRVLERRSDMSSTAERLVIVLRPDLDIRTVLLSGSYAFSRVREKARGIDHGAAGDPRLAEWSPNAFDVRHRFQLHAGVNLGPLTLSMFGALQSGRPFTPMIRGDVNGDGFSDDRAFILDPEHVGDPAAAAGMDSLLSGAPKRVRRCLERQSGRIAGRNSCRGPWTSTLNVRADLRPNRGPLARTALSLTISNPHVGLDRLIHGGDDLGWGSVSDPENVLYAVRGFDPGTSSFLYAVNPRFGRPRPGGGSLVGRFRVSIEARVGLGATRPEQQIDRWGPARRGERLSADSLRTLYTRQIPDPYLPLLLDSDSLRLDSAQIDALRRARRAFEHRIDSLAAGFARSLSASRHDVPRDSLLADQTEFTNAALGELWSQREEVRRILSSFQYRLTPSWKRLIFDMPRPPREGEIVVP